MNLGFASNRSRRAFQALALWFGLIALTVQGLVPLCVTTAAVAATNGVQSIVICTVHGYETIQLDAEGKPLPNQPSTDHGNSTCFLGIGCHMGLGFTAPAVAQFAVPAKLTREPALAALLVAPSRSFHFSYVSRAPPVAPDTALA